MTRTSAIILSLLSVTIPVSAQKAVPTRPQPAPAAVKPFDLSEVRLLPGPCRDRMDADRRYLLSLDPDRLLYNFRVNAGLPAPGKPLGGWEAPDSEVRGHFVGHYLSACSLMYRSTGDPVLKARAELIVRELARCQQAFGSGYLSAFPTSFFDRLEAGKPVWAPYYTIHKILAGLLDVYQLCGDQQALEIARRMADYFKQRTDKLSDQQMNKVLRNEFGGMANSLYDLYADTGDTAYRSLAHRFEQASFLDPLAQGQDDLTNLHANTHIPEILGAGRRYELMDDPSSRDIVSYFWDRIVDTRSYATGGSNEAEHWGAPDALAHTLAANNEETCTTYNMLKVTRDLIRWTADPKYGDFYERAYFNGILPAQDPSTGMMIYYLPLAAGHTKQWGTPTHSFWCCYGTGVESFAKLGDSLYFHDANGLYVNLYVASELRWASKGVRVTQITRFPEEQGTTLVIHAARPVEMAIHLRVPAWAGNGFRVSVNGRRVAGAAKSGTYFTLQRRWREGDRVHVSMPMSLHTQPMPDNQDMAAVTYGPLVLAGVMDQDDAPLVDKGSRAGYLFGSAKNIDHWLKPVPGKPLTFRTTGQPHKLTFVPLYQVIHQRYGVYWLFTPPGSSQYQNIIAAFEEQRKQDALVVDRVIPGNADNEQAHQITGEATNSGSFEGEGWRDAGQSFSWELHVLPDIPMMLDCEYWGDESGRRTFDIRVDGQKIATQTLLHNRPGEFFHVLYPIPAEMTRGKSKVTIQFVAHDGNTAGGVFGCATLRKAP